MRLRTLLKWDALFLFKYGIVLASIIVAIVWLGIIAFMPQSTMRYVIPIVFVTDFAVSGFLYMGAMLFMDKEQGTLSAQMMTPLSVKEYVLSKIGVLVGLITTLAIVLGIGVYVAHGIRLNPIGVVLVSATASIFFVIFGLIMSIFCKSFTDMILPMGLVMAVLFLPFLTYLDRTFPFFIQLGLKILPTYSMLVLIEALFVTQPVGAIVGAFTYVLVWCFVLFKVSIRLFNGKMIGRKEDIDG